MHLWVNSPTYFIPPAQLTGTCVMIFATSQEAQILLNLYEIGNLLEVEWS